MFAHATVEHERLTRLFPQHPPEYLPAMFAALRPPKQFVLGTRYAQGVEIDENWPLYRRVISGGARLLALPLTTASDPMTGFFGIRKEAVRPSPPSSIRAVPPDVSLRLPSFFASHIPHPLFLL